jgi:deoxyribonuclease-4
MSIAGGTPRAIARARSVNCTAFQLFLKNNNQWRGKALETLEIDEFHTEMAKGDLVPPVAHASYLINLASQKDDISEKSVAAMIDELERARLLGVPGVVLHPGSHLGLGEADGLALIAERINQIFTAAPKNPAAIYLETTAGQGTCLGCRFEHLAEIIDRVEDKTRLGVCMDTCHVFAAGYDVRTAPGVKAMLAEFDRIIGLEWLRAIHTNDSKKGLGSRVDRHTHIGQGEIGEAGFAALLRDERLRAIPFILETPKGDDLAEDVMNLATLRRLGSA